MKPKRKNIYSPESLHDIVFKSKVKQLWVQGYGHTQAVEELRQCGYNPTIQQVVALFDSFNTEQEYFGG